MKTNSNAAKVDLPQIVRRFRRAVTTLNAVMDDLQRKYPEACYYLANDELHLMIGQIIRVPETPTRRIA